MYRTMSLHAYDCLDQIAVALVITTHPDFPDLPAEREAVSVQVRGSGEDESHQWVKDALVAMIEAL